MKSVPDPAHALTNRFSWVVLAGLCLLVYCNAVFCGFIYDDIPAILANPGIGHPGRYLLDTPDLLYSLNYLAARDNPLPYHATSILLHIVTTALVFGFLKLFFSPLSSLIGAAVFAVHPIHAEAVTWITALPFILMGMFILLTYLLYHRATVTLRRQGRVNIPLYCLTVALFLYYMARNVSFYFLVPFLLMFSDIVFGRWRKQWKLWLPFLFIAALRLFLIRGFIGSRIAGVVHETGGGMVWQNPFQAFIYSLIGHARLLVWPKALTLFHHPVLSPYALAGGIFVVGIVAASTVFWYRKARVLFFALGFFVLFLAPTYSPLTLGSLIGERYAYFPSVALCVFIAFFFERLYVRTPQLRRGVMFCICFVIAALAVRTVVRNEDWRNQSRFWRATVDVSPASPWAHNNMGYAYQQEGNLERAVREYRRAIELKPNLADAHNNLATILHQTGRIDEAIATYQHLLSIDPDFVKAYNNLGVIYHQQGRIDEAIAVYKRAVTINPRYAFGYFNLSQMYAAAGKSSDAEENYQKALVLDPNLATLPSALR